MSATSYTFERASEKRHVIGLIDGPNMSNLGKRSKQIYGQIGSLSDLQEYVQQRGKAMGVDVEVFSSNHEGEILEYIHGSADDSTDTSSTRLVSRPVASRSRTR